MGHHEWIREELEALRAAGRYRELTVWESRPGPWMSLGGRNILQMSSNNYLGLTNHAALKQAAIQAIETYGVGSGSVRTIAGTLDIHQRLEEELARFKGTEAALVFQSGLTANIGILSALLDADDVVISDELNHASIIDGIRLTKAHRKIYAHKNMDHLETCLQESSHYARRMIVTDGVFSMDGDIAPLPDIVSLAEKYDALVYVDDAHGSGVLGNQGKGTADHFGLSGRVHIQVGTLSKAIGVTGGYFAGSLPVRQLLIQRARTLLFSTSPSPAVSAACLAALDVMRSSPDLIERLWSYATYFRNALQQMGYDTGASETPIIPIIIGDAKRTLQFSDTLLEEGLFAQGIVYPTVAPERGRVRLIITASHTKADLDFALDVLRKAGRQYGLI